MVTMMMTTTMIMVLTTDDDNDDDDPYSQHFASCFSVFEEFDGRMDHIPTRVQIFNNGHTVWAAPFVFKTSCRIDVSNFPFDHQQCRLKFGSWSYHGSELDLWNMKNFSRKTNTSVEHGEWEIRNVTIRRNTPKYECCENVTYPDVTFTIHLKRRSLFYIVNLILPNFLIAMLGFFSFFIPVECGERISFVITVLLSMTVFLLLVAENIPATSDAIPVIGVFYILTIIEISLALVATGITLKIYYSYLYGHGLSPRMKRFLFQKLGPLLRFSSETLPKLEATNLTAPKADSSGCPHSPRILTKTKRRLLTEIDSSNVEMANRHGIHSEEGGELATLCNGHAGESESFFVAAKNDADEHSTKDLNRRDISEAESRIAAAIVDRACMWIFSVIFVLSTAVVMLMPFVRHNEFA